MNRIRVALFAAFLAIPCLSHAETVELVTYFPAGGGAGEENPQVDTLRVGNAYENLPVPADGTALIAGSLGIGIPVPANGTIAPEADLHIVDEGDDAELVLQRFVGNALNSEVTLAAREGRGVLNAAGSLELGVNNQTRLFIQATGRIGIGDPTLFSAGALAPLHINVAGPNTTPLLLEGFYNTADPLFLMFRRTVGTPNNRQAIRNNDGLGEILFQGSTGPGLNDLSTGARIQAEAAGAWANNSAPTDLLFFTAGTAGGGERMRIAAAGNVGIGTTAPNPAAALEISFTNNNPVGFLPPRMTTGQRDAIAAPPEGLTIYNTNTHRAEVRTNTAWVPVGGTPAIVFAQGDGVISGTNNAVNETATFNITLPAGTWVVQAHAQIDQKNTPALSFRINGVEVQTTPDSGTGRDLVLVFGVRQVTVAGPGPTAVPVTLVATTSAGLKEQNPVNFMITATQVG